MPSPSLHTGLFAIVEHIAIDFPFPADLAENEQLFVIGRENFLACTQSNRPMPLAFDNRYLPIHGDVMVNMFRVELGYFKERSISRVISAMPLAAGAFLGRKRYRRDTSS